MTSAFHSFSSLLCLLSGFVCGYVFLAVFVGTKNQPPTSQHFRKAHRHNTNSTASSFPPSAHRRSRVLLLTGYTKHVHPTFLPNHEAFLAALTNFTSCAARNLGVDYDIITNIPDHILESWPFPHYIKLYGLEKWMHSLKNDNDNNKNDEETRRSQYDWILWIDADIRILNFDFPLFELLEYADNPDSTGDNPVHLIINNQYKGYDTYINNMFLIRNDRIWGPRFFQLWKDIILSKNTSCGAFDQCPFGVAMLQLLNDYHDVVIVTQQQQQQQQQQHKQDISISSDKLSQRPLLKEYESIANEDPETDPQENIIGPLLSEWVCRYNPVDCYDENSTENTHSVVVGGKGIRRVGPILMIPAWSHTVLWEKTKGAASEEADVNTTFLSAAAAAPPPAAAAAAQDDILSRLSMQMLSVEPTSAMETVGALQRYHPLAIHAAYSKLFCNAKRKADFVTRQLFAETFRNQLTQQCTPQELIGIDSPGNPQCWGRIPVWDD